MASSRPSLSNPSITKLPARSLNSLRMRGLRPTLRMIHAYADDALFDLRYGLRTDRWVDLNDLEVVGDNKKDGIPYQPMKVLVFRDALKSFKIPSDGVFVDYGSGKGRVIFLSILYGFRRAVGVEFAQDLCNQAEHNTERFRKRTGKQFETQIVNIDATFYPVKDDDCVFFFYHPFESKVLEQVLSNIRSSLQSKPRLIHILYAHPVHRKVLDDDLFWRTVSETTSGGIETVVYYQPR